MLQVSPVGPRQVWGCLSVAAVSQAAGVRGHTWRESWSGHGRVGASRQRTVRAVSGAVTELVSPAPEGTTRAAGKSGGRSRSTRRPGAES